MYPISPFYGFTPRQRSALLVFLDAGEGAARPGSGTQNRTRGRDGRMGTTPFAASDEFFPERISALPACCPAEMAHGFACGARTTARHGPRVAHRVTRHRAVLLARGPPRVASAFPVGGARRPLVASQSGRGAAGQARACVIRLVLVPRPARGGTGRWPAPRARALWIRLAGCSRLSCYRCDAPGCGVVWWGWTCLGLG